MVAVTNIACNSVGTSSKIDSNGEDVNGDLGFNNIIKGWVAQSFTGTGKYIDKVTLAFSISGGTITTGNVQIYAISGTHGSSAIPIGSALATSDDVDLSVLSSGDTADFVFSTNFKLVSGTNYCFAFEYSGDSSNYIYIGVRSVDEHSGNYSFSNFDGNWTADNTKDVSFQIYGKDLMTNQSLNTATLTNQT